MAEVGRRALVTGGAGFLGSHLCGRLLAEGYRVVCVDNLRTGSIENVAHLLDEPGFEYLDHDVTLPIEIRGKLDEIYHLASPASPTDFERIPIPILKAGALGTYNALGLAKARNARLLLASSSEVYGDPLVHPQHEEYRGNVDQVGIRGVYDEAKRYAEAITMAYHRHHKVETRIARIFNTYGPFMRPDDGRVIPSFVCRALAGEPLVVHGDGSQTRSVQYVDDLIEGFFRLMNSAETRPVNLGNPTEMAVLQIAKTVIDLSGSGSDISFGPLPPGDPKRRCPDITRARESLGWEPRIPAREGLQMTLAWFAGRLERSAPKQ
ncbi:NAD-dependent epimerase/dehydratase family protein [Rubrobacter tropicus]|uniref:NAD-dependent epimerase/dehydratase family protein n=1 Tax=Rubrobacter tropicus TaxID=2653851 RepID=A0A6G8Q6R8_9ACTN|nr:UDP-glucuronic acid decarboxylase family protein [Rubrobacter tropicus]QIN82175.1 NAD-dependent epimerase/dehydratase family protein [Rubrobacter tropicus]